VAGLVLIDAHQHFWNTARGDYGWMASLPPDAPILRTILPGELEPHLKRWGIERTVLVQAAPSVEETEYMLGLADATPFVGRWSAGSISRSRRTAGIWSGWPSIRNSRACGR
jgi:predicted TIM-barrel fold metal-dependent hydrolase